MSPQTPLTPLYNPLLPGGYSKAISSDSLLLASFQWVFCVFTCNHPPQQTLHPEPSALPSSQAFREEGPIYRYTRDLAWNLIRRTLHLRPKQSCPMRTFAPYALQHTPQQTHHPVAPLLPSSQAFREEGAFTRYVREILECCSGGRCTCVSANSPDSTKSSPSCRRI